MAAILNADEVAAKFSESLRTIAKLQGFSEQTVTLAEVGVVLKTCAGRTKVAKPDAIIQRTRARVLHKLDLTEAKGPGDVTINTGSRGMAGRVWMKTGGPYPRSKVKGGPKVTGKPWMMMGQMSDDAQKFTPSKFHLKPKDWIDVREATMDYGIQMKNAVLAARKSASLARQSWVQMADDLGVILEDIPGGGLSSAGIAKARAAIASNGQTYCNGIGTPEYNENKSYFATLVNRLPYWPKIGLDSVLLGVLAGRAKFFEQNVARAVFASHAATVKAYPWLKLVGAETG